MTDFYTVLRNALDRVGAADDDPDQRDRVYGHVREVMVRKLQGHRPRLRAAEIDQRLVDFDTAIGRIEEEVAVALQARGTAVDRPEEEPPEPEAPAAEEPPPEVPAAGAADEDEEGDPASAEADPPAPDSIWGSPAIDLAWDETTAQWHDPGDRDEIAPEPPPPPPMMAEWEERLEVALGADRDGAARPAGDVPAEDPFTEGQWDLDSVVPGSDREAYAPAPEPSPEPPPAAGTAARRGPSLGRWLPKRRRATDGADADLGAATPAADMRREPVLDAAGPVGAAAPPAAAPGLVADARPRIVTGREIRSAPPPENFGAPTGLGRVQQPVPPGDETKVLAPAADRAMAYLDGGGGGPPVFADAPIDSGRDRPAPRRRGLRDRLPTPGEIGDRVVAARRRAGRPLTLAVILLAVVVIAWAAWVFVPLVFGGGGETGAATPETTVADAQPAPAAADIGSPIILFNGQNPEVFEGGTDNPARYVGTVDGGFVRVMSSTSATARAAIGPGVAGLLGGERVRVTLELRATPGRAAPTLRVGYQRGLSILSWQVVDLGADFTTVTVEWDIPASVGNLADHLLMEPGIPGDGTAADIQRITIEVLS